MQFVARAQPGNDNLDIARSFQTGFANHTRGEIPNFGGFTHLVHKNTSGIIEVRGSCDQLNSFAESPKISGEFRVSYCDRSAALNLVLKERANAYLGTQDVAHPHDVHLSLFARF